MADSQDTLCACGCQEIVAPGRTWRPGHWIRAYPHGRSLEERFWAYVVKTDTCWVWKGARNPRGYGMLRNRELSKYFGVHRFSYELHYGPIPEGVFCLHHCDNPSCVRPDHLFLGTARDNTQDMIRKGRHNSVTHPESRPYGENKSNAKLTNQEVRYIRQIYAAGIMPYHALGRLFGVSTGQIAAIIRRKKWTRLP